MTTDERFERIEHVTAGLAEERRKDRDEFRSLWRDNQRQINDLTLNIAGLRDRETDRQFRQTDARIQTMISAMGEFIAASKSPTPPV